MTWQAGEHRKVDASEIGLAPGKWPPGIEYEGYTFYRQNIIHDKDCEEVLYGEYKEQYTKLFGMGRRLTIFND